jgi:hypothetical protein
LDSESAFVAEVVACSLSQVLFPQSKCIGSPLPQEKEILAIQTRVKAELKKADTQKTPFSEILKTLLAKNPESPAKKEGGQ